MTMYSFDNRADSPWPNATLDRGVIIGHTTPTSSRVWVRTDKKGNFQLLVFDRKQSGLGDAFAVLRDKDSIQDGELSPFPHREVFSVDGSTDYTKVIDLKELTPATQYSYAVLEKEGEQWRFVLGHEKRRRFRTPKGEGAYAFGLLSCHNPYKKSKKKRSRKAVMGVRNLPDLVNMDVWDMAQDALARERKDTKVDFLIAGGDQAYCDGCDDVSLWHYLEKCIRGMKEGKRRPTKEEMLSWYRDMYRGYWGFPQVRSIFGQYPTYMIWDDHEIRDGWGSHKMKKGDHEINEVLFGGWDECITEEQARDLITDMVEAAKQAYLEYEHSHNPPVPHGQYDYHFEAPNSYFYVLDGRGHRDFDAAEHKILGKEQMVRFRKEVEGINPSKHKFLFVVSAVPVLHMKSIMRSEGMVADVANVTDDLRDAWENEAHDAERAMLLDILFSAAEKGIKVCILSGDVHVTAAFKMQRGSAVIHQLTSSAITYNTPKIVASVLGWSVEDDGESDDGYSFRRLAMLTDPSFALIKVNPEEGRVTFQVYKAQSVPATAPKVPEDFGAHKGEWKTRSATKGADEQKVILSNSVAKLDLDFKPE